MKSPLYAPNSIKLGLFSYKSGSLFNCDGGSVLAYQIQHFSSIAKNPVLFV